MKEDKPWIAADCVVFDTSDRLLLIRRKNEPYKGCYAFPGGFVEIGETTEKAALRELKEETGVTAGGLQLIGVYSDPRRDPRHHCISIAYLALVQDAVATAGDDAAAAEFVSNWRGLSLAFDHNTILSDALALRARVARRPAEH
jgi:8-oxo-dGTP diphosphatase